MAVLKDSGDRREFITGAVRDMAQGKGRCDLLPLDVVAKIVDCLDIHKYSNIFADLSDFQKNGDTHSIIDAIGSFARKTQFDIYDLILETSHQLEDGALKYGDNNWRKGMPTNVFLDSAVRHLLKLLSPYFKAPSSNWCDVSSIKS